MEPKLDTKRVQSLTDATFAVVMTILIFDINIPGGLTEDQLIDYFYDKEIPAFIVFFISFILLGIFWIGNHYYQSLILNTNRFHIFLNILFLSIICIIPFSAKLLIEYKNQHFSFIFFSINLIIARFLHYLLIVYSEKKGFFDPETISSKQIKQLKRRVFFPLIIKLLLIPLSFWVLNLSVYLFMIPILFHLIPEHSVLNIFKKSSRLRLP
jgi:uncharacterized membrane protein